jgi:phthalate 4,5-dioxygenase reductase subunit
LNAITDTQIDTGDLSAAASMSLVVQRKLVIARDIVQFELVAADQSELPPFTAGSHIAVTTPNGLLRRYSLCNAPAERQRYVIAIKRDAEGGGGSVSMIDDLKEADLLPVSAPLNYFPLAEHAQRHVLIAGGIGITPVRSMIHELQAKNADFDVIYCARFPESSAFLDDLADEILAGRVLVHHTHGDPARGLDLGPIVATPAAGTHLYCCGPRRLMQGVREATAHWPAGTVHFEDFGTSEHVAAGGEKGFTVRLARTGVTVRVAPGVSILDALRERGLPAPSSCESGTCGSCRVGLLSGVAEHRDYVLDDDEHDSAIMICVSRAQSDELVLDL